MMGQGKVHVVAAHQEVVAHRQPLQDQLAGFFGNADQRQIGGATPDVADQELVAQLQLSPPPLAHGGQPSVNGGLRFLEQYQTFRQAGGQGSLMREFARTGIERSGNGQHHDLIANGSIWEGRLPRTDHVRQVMLRSRNRGDFRYLAGGIPWEDRLMAIDPAVGQPRLGRANNPLRHLGRLPPRQLSRRPRLSGCHGRPKAPLRPSDSVPKYRNDGSMVRDSTVPAATSCGMDNN